MPNLFYAYIFKPYNKYIEINQTEVAFLSFFFKKMIVVQDTSASLRKPPKEKDLIKVCNYQNIVNTN